MTIYKKLIIVFLIFTFTFLIGAESMKIPETNAGKMLNRFLGVLESGKIEGFVKTFFSNTSKQGDRSAQRIRFLSMVHRMHGGFKIFNILKSTDNFIEVIGQSKKRKDWRRILINIKKENPSIIAGMDIDMASAPAEYLKTLPKIKIKRDVGDDSIISGDMAKR